MVTSTRFPDVPMVPGVPAVFRNETNPGNVASVLPMLADNPGVSTAPGAKWGIFEPGGKAALECDSVLSLEPNREFRVSDYPVENGGFASYNNVATPATTRVTVTKGGTDSDRQSFLDALDKLIESVQLVNVVTPDSSFLDRKIARYDYSRSSDRGMTLLSVELQLVEIRQTATTQFSDSKQPSGTPATNAGPVQATPTAAKDMPPAAPPSTNPAIQDIAPLTDASTLAERASVVSRVVQAGGSIGDLVTKGVSFQTIPTLARAAQSLTTTIGGQATRIDLAQKATGLFANVYVNDALIVGGALVENDNPVVRSAYLGFAGELFFHDTQTGGSEAPTYDDLGSRYALLYAGA